jgi:hypothetical protein
MNDGKETIINRKERKEHKDFLFISSSLCSLRSLRLINLFVIRHS